MQYCIQIIDDNVALTTLLAKALAKFGYRPVVENNPLLAVNTVRHYMPDLILLDVMMPERDGGRVLLDLRNDLSLRYIPVVLLTAIAREAQALAHTGGITSVVLAKPVQLNELLAVIKHQIEASLSYQKIQQQLSQPQFTAHHCLNQAEIIDLEGIDTDSPSSAANSLTTPAPPSFFQELFPAQEPSREPTLSLFQFPNPEEEEASRV